MPGLRILPVVLALFVFAIDIVAAQQGAPPQTPSAAPRPQLRRKKPPEPAPAPKAIPVPVLPQEKPLADLSEIIGALSFLTQLCSPGSSSNPWRVRMEGLVESEGENSGLREKMMGAYNRGFSEYATSYRQCTDSARTTRRVLTRDAARLARDLERRFGS